MTDVLFVTGYLVLMVVCCAFIRRDLKAGGE